MKFLTFPKIALVTVTTALCLVGQVPNTVSFPEIFQETISEVSAKPMQSFKARVVRVADGDTVTVVEDGKPDCGKRCRLKIRLLGIDAPEMNMPYGQESKVTLERLIRNANNKITVSFQKKDRYKRYVGKLEANGKDLNLEMIKLGMAWYFKKYRKDVDKADQRLYEKAQDTARDRKIGLWRDSNPMAPWDWRKLKKQ